MKYKVLEYFTDLQDGNYAYNTDDTYPRKGYVPSEKRINELATDGNLRKRPVIAVDEPETIVTAEETEKQAEPESPAEVKPNKRKRKS